MAEVGTSTGLGFPYSLRRSRRRKSLEVRISQGQVLVSVPHFVNEPEVLRFLISKRAWILKKVGEQNHLLDTKPKREFCDGANWPYLNENLTLRLYFGSKLDVNRRDNELLISLSRRSKSSIESQVRGALEFWYKEQALRVLSEKSFALAKLINQDFTEVRVRKTKSRWGHCTSKGVLQYNWLIMLAPEAIADYLVAHEVSHLRHFNHSPEFWSLVASLCPDYQQRRRWLKSEGFSLWF
ncbi:M48 family metallopeptidase [Sessilibacter sp. MAH2]